MPRPRTPLHLAEITGATERSPGNYRGRREAKVDALGDPPDTLTEAEEEAWRVFASEIPWLGQSDRALLELACRLRVRLRNDPEMGVMAMAQLRLCLSSMGATPADRSKVSFQDDEDEDDEFFN
jgi:phage terminase small subunit